MNRLLQTLSSVFFSWLLLAALPAQAASWQGIEPGVTTKAQVISAQGEPSRVLKVGEKEVLLYRGGRTIKGTNQVQIRINRDPNVVERIDVFPSAAIDRPTIESTYGGSCEQQGAGATCYVPKLTADNRVYLHYAELGLAVFFRPDGKSVFNFVYTLTAAARETAATANAQTGPPPADGQTSTGTTGAASEAASESLATPASTFGNADAFQTSKMENPLTVGGMLFLSGEASTLSPAPAAEPVGLNLPSVVELFLDGRPNDRVRGMVVGRLLYDPAGTPRVGAGAGPEAAQVQLDQLWLKFDLANKVFLTVGRQHAKWGTGRIWSPVDFLAVEQRNPLQTFDYRVGNDLVRVHLPLESLGANLYAVGLLAGTAPLQLGGALRAELVLGTTELALSALFRQGSGPRYGLDVSAGLGPLDLYADLGVFTRPPVPLWELAPGVDPTANYPDRFQRWNPTEKILPQATVGAVWSADVPNGQLILNLEGFYNSLGYRNPELLPWLNLQGSYHLLYNAQLYAAAVVGYLSSMSDGLALTATTIANLSDGSYIARFHGRITLLSDMELQLYGMVPFGKVGGEFRPQRDVPGFEYQGETFPAFTTPSLQWLAGIGLRIAF